MMVNIRYFSGKLATGSELSNDISVAVTLNAGDRIDDKLIKNIDRFVV